MPDAPAAALTTPMAEAPIPDLVNNILGGKQYISPSYWLGWAMEKVCGVNPFDWAAQQFAGDWNAAAEASSALNNLAEFNTRYGDTIKRAAADLIPVKCLGFSRQGTKVELACLERKDVVTLEEKLLSRISGRGREAGDRDVASDRGGRP
jgi:hypothetical protein